jgi:DNA-binding response OmpR family regulator
VLKASDGAEALSVASGWDGPIDAMISDVAMPGLRGPDLAASLAASHPAMRVMFVSGEGDGPLSCEALPLLAKPFRPSQLVARVRDLLDQ